MANELNIPLKDGDLFFVQQDSDGITIYSRQAGSGEISQGLTNEQAIQLRDFLNQLPLEAPTGLAADPEFIEARAQLNATMKAARDLYSTPPPPHEPI